MLAVFSIMVGLQTRAKRLSRCDAPEHRLSVHHALTTIGHRRERRCAMSYSRAFQPKPDTARRRPGNSRAFGSASPFC